jgi:PAS domain S-box-containing protein
MRTPKACWDCSSAAPLATVSVVGRPVEARARPDQLAAILGGIGHGVTAQGPDGELVYANDAAARICGLETSDELLALSVSEVVDRFEIVGEDGAPLAPERLPNRLAFVTGETHEGVVGYRLKPGGEERWSILRSTPQLSETGAVELVVNVFQDVTAERSAEARIRFLAEASAILSASLGVDETLAELAALLVPRLADYCIVDLVGEDESLRQVVISHRSPEREALLRELRRRYHPEANPGHPVARVIETRAPLLIPDARVGALAEAAVDEEHMRMYEELEALSYIVVPLATRGRLLGTISLGTGESRRRFGAADLELAADIAVRAALAIDNALLLEEAQRSFAQLDTLLVSAPVGIGFWDRELRFVRVNDALAAINRLPAEEHVGRALADVIPHLAPRLEPLYRQVLESGEPIVHTESTDDAGEQIGDKRHWLSSYYPVRAPAEGGVIGVGAVIMEITDRKRADDRLRLLAEAGELFSSSLDREEIFRRIAHVVVPRIADACNIFLADGQSLLRVARAHADPELEQLMHTMPDSYAVPEVTPPLMRRVVGAGEPLLVPTVTRERVDELEQIGLDRKAFLRVGSRSMMFVPFVSRGETLGVMTLGSREAGRYGESDLDLALELARRASAAIDNARLVRELRFRTTLLESQQEASVDGLLVVSPNGRLLSHNRRFAELWGFSDELIAQGSDEAALEQAVEKVADPEAFLERVEYLYAHPDETSREEILLKDGRVLDRHGTPVRGPDGEFHGWLWSFRDVTERKVAENALRAAQSRLERRAEAARALRFVDDGVFLVDRGGVVRLWNPAATRMTGLEAAEVTGRAAADVLAGWPLEPAGERAQAFPYDGPSGERWLSLTAGAFPHGTVYAFRDLTDERAVEQLKSDFVSTVSHELRTPLAAIYGAAMTLRRDDVALSPDQQEGMLGVIAGESERLAKIVNDILLASRLDSGAAQVSIGRADATELARSVLAAAETHLRPGIELSLSAPDPGPYVAADPDGLRQVLVNLVENAVKYSPEGGLVEVEIDPSDGHVRFVVRDRGLGIPPSEHERIFEKFFRLDPNLSRGVGGTGLGLYISREIVRRMGGQIEVESEPGQGSTFTFELPAA